LVVSSAKHILVLAEDAAVRQTKKLVLEHLGFAVAAVSTLREFDHAIKITTFDLVILGRTVSDPHKREAARASRTIQPNTPLLEICNVSPCVLNADYVLRSPNPEDLAEMVKAIVGEKRRSAAEPS
jgi:DNA-binding response OmpR family regulator